MSRPLSVIVVGAGIVGVSAAEWLRRDGHRVTLIDRVRPGDPAQTSFGNAGILAASSIVPIPAPGLAARIPGLLLSRDSPLFLRWRYLPRFAPWLLRFLSHGRLETVERIARSLAMLTADSTDEHLRLAAGTGADQFVRRSPLRLPLPGPAVIRRRSVRQGPAGTQRLRGADSLARRSARARPSAFRPLSAWRVVRCARVRNGSRSLRGGARLVLPAGGGDGSPKRGPRHRTHRQLPRRSGDGPRQNRSGSSTGCRRHLVQPLAIEARPRARNGDRTGIPPLSARRPSRAADTLSSRRCAGRRHAYERRGTLRWPRRVRVARSRSQRTADRVPTSRGQANLFRPQLGCGGDLDGESAIDHRQPSGSWTRSERSRNSLRVRYPACRPYLRSETRPLGGRIGNGQAIQSGSIGISGW